MTVIEMPAVLMLYGCATVSMIWSLYETDERQVSVVHQVTVTLAVFLTIGQSVVVLISHYARQIVECCVENAVR